MTNYDLFIDAGDAQIIDFSWSNIHQEINPLQPWEKSRIWILGKLHLRQCSKLPHFFFWNSQVIIECTTNIKGAINSKCTLNINLDPTIVKFLRSKITPKRFSK